MKLNNNEAKAVLRQVRVSPQKLNLVAQMIKGQNAIKAMEKLLYCKKRIAVDVRKTGQSAISNAQNNGGLNPEKLIVKEAFVGSSIRLKRFMPRGRGRSGIIYKPFSHLTVIVKEEA